MEGSMNHRDFIRVDNSTLTQDNEMVIFYFGPKGSCVAGAPNASHNSDGNLIIDLDLSQIR